MVLKLLALPNLVNEGLNRVSSWGGKLPYSLSWALITMEMKRPHSDAIVLPS
jgi:hypothetical protein